MGGTKRSLGGEPVIVNGVSDHVHILLTLPATLALADTMRALKAKSSGWLRRTLPSFAWQLGYAFSVSESNAGHVKRYMPRKKNLLLDGLRYHNASLASRVSAARAAVVDLKIPPASLPA